MRSLRDYQRDAVEAIEDAWDGGVQRPAIVAATGLGKTDIVAALAAQRVCHGGRVLALAHRRELLDQITERCRMHLPDHPHSVAGIVAGELDQRSRPIVAAMVPTLRSAKRRARFEPFGPGDLVIVDECHHAGAKSYVDVLEHFGAFDESSGVQALGVTATLYEAGRKHRPLAEVWQKVVYDRGIGWAIEHEWLVPPIGLAVVADHIDLAKAKTQAGDWSEGDLGAMVAQDAEQIADAWCEHAADRITVGFLPTKESAEALLAAFTARGVNCELVLGETTAAQRGSVSDGTGIYGRLARGETRVMLGLMVPTEGWDAPPVSCVLMARPTKIDGLYQQCVGRGLRLSPGKRDCLVLDVVGVTRSASLRTLKDLVPTAEYGETSPQACARCGNYRVPIEQFDPRCVCPPLERDPNGGRLELVGPQTYVPVDLMGEALADDGDVLWLQTRGGISFVPGGGRLVVVQQEAGGTWKAGVVPRDSGRGERIVAGVDHATAKRCAEEWARANVEGTYWRRAAPWRRQRVPGSVDAVRAARFYGVADPESYTKAALSDLISIRAASRRLDRGR